VNTVLAPIGRFLLAPWRGRAWRDLWFVILSSALSLLPLGLIGLPWAFFAPIYLPSTLAFLALLAAVLLGPQLTTLRRSAYYKIRGAQIPRAPHTARDAACVAAPFLPRMRARLRHPRTWRQACYHLIAGPAANLVGVIAGTMWVSGLICFGWLSAAIAFGPNWKWLSMATSQALWGALGCLVVVYLTPWLVMASVRWDLKFATDLLGPSRAERLARRVTDLTESRAAVVDAADAERRRIERDLHDGAQQRLVSLAMNLGLARATLKDLPEDARTAPGSPWSVSTAGWMPRASSRSSFRPASSSALAAASASATSPPPAPAWSRPRTRRAAGSSATCTTGRSSAWSTRSSR